MRVKRVEQQHALNNIVSSSEVLAAKKMLSHNVEPWSLLNARFFWQVNSRQNNNKTQKNLCSLHSDLSGSGIKLVPSLIKHFASLCVHMPVFICQHDKKKCIEKNIDQWQCST